MNNIKKYNEFILKNEDIVDKKEELSKEEKERRSEINMSRARQSSAPTYYSYVTNSIETTTSINTKAHALSKIRRGIE